MKILLLLPLLLASVAANEEEILKSNEEVLMNALKQLEGTKFNLSKEVIQKINEGSGDIEERIAGITSDVDDYVDRVLANAKKFILRSGLDPTEVPDATLKLIPTGTITLSSGWLQDTSLIQRNGNATVSYSASTRVMSLNLPIKFSTLLVTYKYLTKVLLLSINGEANAKIQDLIININLSYDFNTYQASLDKFEIRDSGRFSLKFTGNSLVDWITNTMTSVVTVFLQPIVIRIIELMVKGNLETIVEKVNEFIASIFHPGTVL